MSPVMSLVLIGTAIVVAVGAVAVWLAIKRPVQALQRRRRDTALAAAERYTPAPRAPAYGHAELDPCAPGLSDGERVDAMRALLQRGDSQSEADAADTFAPTLPGGDDDLMTTTPMAWKSTLPPDEAEQWARRPSKRSTVRESDTEHIMVP